MAIPFENHFLSVELEAEFGRKFDFAHTESFFKFVCHSAVGTVDCSNHCIKVGILCVPEFYLIQIEAVETEFADMLFAVEPVRSGFGIYFQAFGADDFDTHSYAVVFHVVCKLGIDYYCRFFGRNNRGCDCKRVADEVLFGVCDDEVDVAVETGAGIPARVFRFACVGLDCKYVRLAKFEFVAYIGIKAKVAVVGAANAFAVEIHIADQQ